MEDEMVSYADEEKADEEEYLNFSVNSNWVDYENLKTWSFSA